MVNCPGCNRSISDTVVYCNYCGRRRQFLCSNCLTVNPPDSSFCRVCGSGLSATPINPSSTPQGTPSFSTPAISFRPTSACPRCNQVNEPESVYCYSCGLPLDGGSTVARPIPSGVPGGFWIRFLASVIDGVLLIIVISVLSALLGTLDGFNTFLAICIGGTYYTIGVGVWGTTIGKKTFGLYTVRLDGTKIGLGRALARYLSYWISYFIILIGFIMIGLREDKRGLHDLICDTMVIKR